MCWVDHVTCTTETQASSQTMDTVGAAATTANVYTYVVESKSFRPDIQKPRQMENAVRDI